MGGHGIGLGIEMLLVKGCQHDNGSLGEEVQSLLTQAYERCQSSGLVVMAMHDDLGGASELA